MLQNSTKTIVRTPVTTELLPIERSSERRPPASGLLKFNTSFSHEIGNGKPRQVEYLDKNAPPFSQNGRFGLRNAPYRKAKQAILQCETAQIALQNDPFRNAKCVVLHPVMAQNIAHSPANGI